MQDRLYYSGALKHRLAWKYSKAASFAEPEQKHYLYGYQHVICYHLASKTASIEALEEIAKSNLAKGSSTQK